MIAEVGYEDQNIGIFTNINRQLTTVHKACAAAKPLGR